MVFWDCEDTGRKQSLDLCWKTDSVAYHMFFFQDNAVYAQSCLLPCTALSAPVPYTFVVFGKTRDAYTEFV